MDLCFSAQQDAESESRMPTDVDPVGIIDQRVVDAVEESLLESESRSTSRAPPHPSPWRNTATIPRYNFEFSRTGRLGLMSHPCFTCLNRFFLNFSRTFAELLFDLEGILGSSGRVLAASGGARGVLGRLGGVLARPLGDLGPSLGRFGAS